MSAIITKKQYEFAKVWLDYLNGDVDFATYYEKESMHQGWLYQYKGMTIRFETGKEESFDRAMQFFHERFGLFNVIEDDVTFEPLFNGETLGERHKRINNYRKN